MSSLEHEANDIMKEMCYGNITDLLALKALENEQIVKISSCKTELANIDREEAELKKQLDLLDARRKNTLLMLKKDQEEFSHLETNLTNLKEEVSKIENSSPLQANESESFEKMKELSRPTAKNC
ncbi:hypothetical protein ACH5RR_006422 [Cinchona calisaya]|uniref:Uncharacterized protein n=1 Tax=Cinchona calisaya TaxID=153742 RepID=A0ABD3AP06_9GENT